MAPAVDVFAAGVCMAIMLNNCSHPYVEKGQSERSIKQKICDHDFNIENIHCSLKAVELLKRLLEPNPDERISAAEALIHPWLNPKRHVVSVDAKKPLVRPQQPVSQVMLTQTKYNQKALMIAVKTLLFIRFCLDKQPASKLVIFKDKFRNLSSTSGTNNSIDGFKSRPQSRMKIPRFNILPGERSKDSLREHYRHTTSPSDLDTITVEINPILVARVGSLQIGSTEESKDSPLVKTNMFFKKKSRLLEGESQRSSKDFLRSTQKVNTNHVDRLGPRNSEEIKSKKNIRETSLDGRIAEIANQTYYKDFGNNNKPVMKSDSLDDNIFHSIRGKGSSNTNPPVRNNRLKGDNGIKFEGNRTLGGGLGDSLGYSANRKDASLESRRNKEHHLVPIFRSNLNKSKEYQSLGERQKLSFQK